MTFCLFQIYARKAKDFVTDANLNEISSRHRHLAVLDPVWVSVSCLLTTDCFGALELPEIGDD